MGALDKILLDKMFMESAGHIIFVVGMPQSSRPWQQQCVWYRVIGPGQALREIGFRVDYLCSDEDQRLSQLLDLHRVDRIILHRGSDEPWLQSLRKVATSQAVPLWYDLDDNLIDPTAIEDAAHLRHLEPTVIRGIQNWTRANISCLRQCDAAIFSTEALRVLGANYNTNSRVARNYLPVFYLKHAGERRRSTEQKIRLYYGPGSREHQTYFDFIASALSKTMRDFPRTHLFIGGGLAIPEVLRRLQTRITVLPRLRPEVYFRCLQLMDIALAPLPDDGFSSAKSWIKVLEAAAGGCVWVGSDQSSYREFRDATGTGFLAGECDWVEQLRCVLEQFDYLNRDAERRSLEICERFNMSARVGEYLAILGMPEGERSKRHP